MHPSPTSRRYDRVQRGHCVTLLAHLHLGMEYHEPPGATAVQHTWPLPAARRRQVGDGSALTVIVQELCESRGGRPGLSVLTSLLVSVDVKIY